MNLVWVDMEMTGLEPDTDRIIEVAVVVTDMHLNILAEGPVFAIHQSDETLDKMDAWNKGTHGRSGLIDRVKASTVTEAEAEAALIAFLKQYVPSGQIADVRQHDLPGPPLHGALHAEAGSVFPLPQPRRHDAEGTVPPLEAGTGVNGFKKHQKHTALADIIESIDELKYYREHFIKL